MAEKNSIGEFAATKKKAVLKESFNPYGVKAFGDNLRLMKSFADLFDAELFICKQPTLIAKNTSKKDRERCHYFFHGFNHEAHVEAFEQIYKQVDSIQDQENIINLTSLSGVSEFFGDHIHPTPLGTAAIAEIVSDSLVSNYFERQE